MANFELTEKTTVDTMWFLGGPGIKHDWMAMVMRDSDEQPWYLRYRFRYYSPESEGRDPHDHKDEFRAYTVKPNEPSESPEQLVEAADGLAAMLIVAGFGGELHRLEVHGGAETVTDMLQSVPWASMKTESKEEGEKPKKPKEKKRARVYSASLPRRQ